MLPIPKLDTRQNNHIVIDGKQGLTLHQLFAIRSLLQALLQIVGRPLSLELDGCGLQSSVFTPQLATTLFDEGCSTRE